MRCAALPIATPGRVTSPYGWRNRPSGPDLHTGVDLGAPEGTPVFAMLEGTIRVAALSGVLEGYGNTVVIEHSPQLFALYAHLQRFFVGVGQRVQAGQLIGLVGRTNGTRAQPSRVFSESGAHLHLEFLSRWPPRAKDVDRLDVGAVLASLGVYVPASGPLVQVCAPSSSTTPLQVASLVPSGGARAPGFSSGAGALLLALAAWWWWKKRQSQPPSA